MSATRLTAAARLSARLSSTAFNNRVLASKSFSLNKSRSIASPRLFSTTTLRLSPTDPLSATTLPTSSEESVKAEHSPVDPIESTTSPLSSSGTISAEAASVASAEAEAHHLAPDHEEFPAIDAATLEASSHPSSSPSAPAQAVEEVDPAVVEAEAAAAAEELNARTVFVGGLSWNVDNEWLKDEVLKALELAEGDESVRGVRIARNPMGKSRGFAFIELSSPTVASRLAELTPDIDGRPTEFRLSTSSPRPSRSPRVARSSDSTPRNAPSSTIWIGNVSWGVDEADLQETFASYGEVKRVSLPRDQESGRSRGIAYVEFEGVESAKQAVESSVERGIELDGRVVRLDFAAESSRNGGGQRGGGRGGFGGNRGGRGGYQQGGRGGYGGGRQQGGRQGGGGGGYRGNRQEEW